MTGPELPTIPSGWAWTSLAQIADLAGGITKGQRHDGKAKTRLVPYLRVANVQRGYLELDQIKSIQATEPDIAALRLQPGDILFNEGGDRDKLGRGWIWEGQIAECIHQNHVFRARLLSSELQPKFISHWGNSFGQRWFMRAGKQSVNLASINLTNLRTFPVPVPPPAEQTRILDALDELLSDLDAGVAGIERVLAKLAQYRAAVLKAAVEGALTADWRKQHPKVEPAPALLTRILAERRRRWEEDQLRKFQEAGKEPPKNWKAKYQEPVAPDTANLPPLPEGWCWVSVDQCSSLLQYGSSAKTLGRAEGVPVLRMGNIRADGTLDVADLKYLPSSHEEFPSLLLEPGDLLFNRTNSAELVGKTGLYKGIPSPCSFASYLIRVLVLPGISPPMVAYALNGVYGRAWIKRVVNQTVGQANVNGTKLASFTLPLAPENEQAAIVEAVEDQLSVIEHIEAELAAKLKGAQALRQSILRHAFTGQLVPQDPQDEPAAELLKRIATEREARARKALAAKRAPAKPKRPRQRPPTTPSGSKRKVETK